MRASCGAKLATDGVTGPSLHQGGEEPKAKELHSAQLPFNRSLTIFQDARAVCGKTTRLARQRKFGWGDLQAQGDPVPPAQSWGPPPHPIIFILGKSSITYAVSTSLGL